MSLGKSLRAVRTQRGLTQAKLADLVETTQAYISNIEKDEQKPSLDMLDKIANALGVPIGVIQFLGLEESEIPEEKRELFKMLQPNFRSFFETAFDLGQPQK